MLNNRFFVALLLTIVGTFSLYAQGSAYGRFGYGELSEPAFSAGRAMGGIGYGVRDAKMLNPMNPASYSSVDSLSFLFDVGAYINTAWYKEGDNRASTFDGNINHVGAAFRLTKGLGLSFGLTPFSSVSFSHGVSGTENGISKKEQYTGEGGLNRIYLGLGYNLFRNFSLGVDIAYLFGSTTYTADAKFDGTIDDSWSYRKLKMSGVLADIGAQYTLLLDKNKSVTFGAIYSPKMSLNAKYRQVKQIGGNIVENGDTTITNMGFDYPQTIGAGITFARRNKYMVSADAQYQQWSKARFFDNGQEWDEAGALLRDRVRFALGGQYIPQATGRNYFGKVAYRIGAHYANSYFERDRNNDGNFAGTKEYGISAGFGLPMPDNRSVINLSLDYISATPERKDFPNERYFKITISYTMNEIWFKKYKLE